MGDGMSDRTRQEGDGRGEETRAFVPVQTPALFWEAKQLLSANVIIDDIVWLGGCLAHASDKFQELCWDDPDELLSLLGIPDPRLKDVREEDDDGFEDDGDLKPAEVIRAVSEANKLGFLVHVLTPVRTSWGHAMGKWMYFDQLNDAAVKHMIEWAQSVRRS